jgi:hypothetical protein
MGRDSLHVIDRLKIVYHAYSYGDLQKKLGFELDYTFFQSLITANVPENILKEGKRLKTQFFLQVTIGVRMIYFL